MTHDEQHDEQAQWRFIGDRNAECAGIIGAEDIDLRALDAMMAEYRALGMTEHLAIKLLRERPHLGPYYRRRQLRLVKGTAS